MVHHVTRDRLGGAAGAALFCVAVLLAAWLPAAIGTVAAEEAGGMRRETVVLVAKAASREITAEIADTPSTRAIGLMFRESLGADEGMLFLYDREQPVSMWMRNTYIPLDMLFIRKDGTIARIATDTEPLSEASIAAGSPVIAVLELNAGTARAAGLTAGDRVEHRFFLTAAQ